MVAQAEDRQKTEVFHAKEEWFIQQSHCSITSWYMFPPILKTRRIPLFQFDDGKYRTFIKKNIMIDLACIIQNSFYLL